MSKYRSIAAIGVTLSLAACVSLGSKAPALLLNLTPAQMMSANDTRSVATGEAISIAVPIAPQALATNRIAVTDGPVAIAYVKDVAWVEPPARLFQRLMAETVAAKTGRVVLDPRQFSMDSGTQITGQLRAFGMDATTSQAVIIYDAALSRDKGKRVETRRFEARQSVGVIDGRSSGNALNQAANRVANDVATWIAALR
jgi:cholesterol transport system auxiliary component